jgi:hypothetical protein
MFIYYYRQQKIISSQSSFVIQLITYRNTKKEFTIWKKKEELGNCAANLMGGIKKEKTIRCRQKDMLKIAEQIIKKNLDNKIL